MDAHWYAGHDDYEEYQDESDKIVHAFYGKAVPERSDYYAHQKAHAPVHAKEWRDEAAKVKTPKRQVLKLKNR